MLAKSPVVLLTAALALFSQTLAAPVQNSTRDGLGLDKEPDVAKAEIDAPFIACLKSKNAYHDNGSMDSDAAAECRHAASGRLQARSLPSVFVKPKQESCGKSIPSNFMEAAAFRAGVNDVCTSLANKMMKNKSGKGTIQHKFNNGSHKKNSWLQQDKNVIVQVSMNLKPKYKSGLKAKKVARATMQSLCQDSLMKLGTKETGCTKELGYYKDSFDILGLGVHDAGIPSDKATTTAVTDGASDLFINNSKDPFGTLRMSWKMP